MDAVPPGCPKQGAGLVVGELNVMAGGQSSWTGQAAVQLLKSTTVTLWEPQARLFTELVVAPLSHT
jgi:hypothetical protein